jgi:hypothetical protein
MREALLTGIESLARTFHAELACAAIEFQSPARSERRPHAQSSSLIVAPRIVPSTFISARMVSPARARVPCPARGSGTEIRFAIH